MTAALAAQTEETSWEGFWRFEGQKGSWTAIRTPGEYDAFVERIPKTRLQKRQPAPPSTDPLLKKPAIDFDRYALVAIWSDNVHIDCKIIGTEREGDDLVVHMAYDAPSEDVRNYAAPLGYGQYHVVRVETFPGQLKLGALNKKAPGT